MILDNQTSAKKIFKWLERYTDNGTISLVTGYFTIGAIDFLAKITNGKINVFKFIIGDIVNNDFEQKDNVINLLHENIDIEGALSLSRQAKNVVRFLKQNKVQIKTLEPNFCHAKIYLHNSNDDSRHHYCILGSSNLTEPGIGLKETSNIELNLALTGETTQYKDLVEWFNNIWNSDKAHLHKTILKSNNKKQELLFKTYLINQIEKIYKEYTPRDLYFKVLSVLYPPDTDTFNQEFDQHISRLEDTIIYQSLYDFQKKGAMSLIKMIAKHKGAILADAVGLGKTWTALAIMKFFQLSGCEVIVLCPKKLEHNWNKYRQNQNSRFEGDKFDFFIRYHTDMVLERLHKEQYSRERADVYFTSPKPRLFVIDESHNFRNAKSERYKFFVANILQKNQDVRVLMLSATPINNTLRDVGNQFKLITQGHADGFKQSHNINSIDSLFNQVQGEYNKWANNDKPLLTDLIIEIPDNFFKLTDSLTMARTRKLIIKELTEKNSKLYFPSKAKPKNEFITPKKIGDLDGFQSIINSLPTRLSGYQPAIYTEQPKVSDITQDEQQRDRALAKMLNILLIKRLESSWFSFHKTIKKVLEHHENVLQTLNDYTDKKPNDALPTSNILEIQSNLEDVEDEEDEEIIEEATLGKRRKIYLSKIVAMDSYKTHLHEDIRVLTELEKNLSIFEKNVAQELRDFKNVKSSDEKLQKLMEIIQNKKTFLQAESENPKVVIFTAYKDTALYLYEQLNKRQFTNLAVVTGVEVNTNHPIGIGETKRNKNSIEEILERFAPITKLCEEKEWKDFLPSREDLSIQESYNEWRQWIQDNNKQDILIKIENPINILIATDVLSEGQNLQDCDLVINYDIHWNPVRIIQRMGRIDRLRSPNKKIYGINFWPADDIDSYLKLKDRVEKRMVSMKLVGSEVTEDLSQGFSSMADDPEFEKKQTDKMLKKMQESSDDIEDNENQFGFNILSQAEQFRQELFEELKNKQKYDNMPNGIFTGFQAKQNLQPKAGVIALLGFPAKPHSVLPAAHQYKYFYLLYLNEKGEEIIFNHNDIVKHNDVLYFLQKHKAEHRYVTEDVDRGDSATIEKFTNYFKRWFAAQNQQKNYAGKATTNFLIEAQKGDAQATEKKQNLLDNYKMQNFDLIVWFLVST